MGWQQENLLEWGRSPILENGQPGEGDRAPPNMPGFHGCT